MKELRGICDENVKISTLIPRVLILRFDLFFVLEGAIDVPVEDVFQILDEIDIVFFEIFFHLPSDLAIAKLTPPATPPTAENTARAREKLLDLHQ